MKSTNMFKILLIISIINHSVYSMMRIPTSTTNTVIAQISNMSKHIPCFEPRTTSQIQVVPQIKITQNQIETLTSEMIKELQPFSTNKATFTPFIELKGLSGGMFKPTLMKLMSWNYNEDPKKILEIKSTNPTEAEIKSAYKKMALKHHPDIGGKKEEFIKVQAAYEYLINGIQRGRTYSKPNNSYQAHQEYNYTKYNQTNDTETNNTSNKSHFHNSNNFSKDTYLKIIGIIAGTSFLYKQYKDYTIPRESIVLKIIKPFLEIKSKNKDNDLAVELFKVTLLGLAISYESAHGLYDIVNDISNLIYKNKKNPLS